MWKEQLLRDRYTIPRAIATMAVVAFVAFWFGRRSLDGNVFPKAISLIQEERVQRVQVKDATPLVGIVRESQVQGPPAPTVVFKDAPEPENQMAREEFDELAQVEKDLLRAQVLIDEDPTNLQAQKDKLVNLLIKEVKFGQEVDGTDYEDAYDQLLELEPVTGMSGLIQSPEMQGIDPDLLHMPFLRLSALGDLEGLANMALEFMDAYPQSPIGSMYLSQAAWRSGDREQALVIVKQALGESTSDAMALQFIEEMQDGDPLERIMRMRAKSK